MFLRSFKFFTAVLLMLVLAACGGGSSAPAATGTTAVATESTVTVSWDMSPGVEYWLFYGQSSLMPTDTNTMANWIHAGSVVAMKVSSPYVVTGLTNGVSYSFSVDGRIDGGPAGPGTTPVIATPTIAGSTWSAGTSTGTNALKSVVFGTSYVAAADNGALFSSADGASWSAITTTGISLSSRTLKGGTYFSGYALVGDTGLVLTSSDAATWTEQTTAKSAANSANLNAITSNYSNLYVAVGDSGTIITSPDGASWTARTSTTKQPLYAVTYSSYNVGTNTGGTWVAVGAAGTLLESPDGLTWALVTLSGISADLRGITYGNGAFVAVGTSGTVLSSTDGVAWTSRTIPAAADLKAVTYGTQFVTVGSGGNIFTSTDGVTWTTRNSSGLDLFAVARGTLTYSAVGAAGTNLLAK